MKLAEIQLKNKKYQDVMQKTKKKLPCSVNVLFTLFKITIKGSLLSNIKYTMLNRIKS